MSFPLLTVLGLLPLVGAVALIFVRGGAARMVGLAFSLVTLVLGLFVSVRAMTGTDLAERVSWIPAFGAWWSLGPIDGLSVTMILLTVILTPVVLIAAWNDADEPREFDDYDDDDDVENDDENDNDTVVGASQRGGSSVRDGYRADPDRPRSRWGARGFFGLVLALEGLSLLVFMATDVLLFYILFEATLIPMYFMIGGFGRRRRGYAAIKFLLFSLAGGLVMLASVIGLYAVSARTGAPTYLISDLAGLQIPESTGRWLFLGFFIAFAIKAPMVPVHTWLPDVAENATPATSTLLVGILDKIGTFGMVRLCLGLFPEASTWATPVVIVLAIISILYGAIAAIGQRDLLRLISYTSVSHFGFMVLGIFAFTSQSLTGSIFYMLNHGLTTAALFLLLGYLIRRRGAQQMDSFGGVQKVAPVLAGLLLASGLSSAALPGMSSFVSEFLVMSGTFSRYSWVAIVCSVAMVLAALYILLMYQRTMTGPVTEQTAEYVRTDLSGRERLAIWPLVVLILVLGFFPKPMLNAIAPTVDQTLTHVGVSDPQPQIAKEHE